MPAPVSLVVPSAVGRGQTKGCFHWIFVDRWLSPDMSLGETSATVNLANESSPTVHENQPRQFRQRNHFHLLGHLRGPVDGFTVWIL